MGDTQLGAGIKELVMVSNRLPVDRITADDGSVSWQTSPGGLVTAVEPIVRQLGCLWVGWAGDVDEDLAPFEIGSMRLAPVTLSATELEEYYEGFSNGTLWPLYHDVISAPEYHREWWECYKIVNQRFAERVAAEAAPGATVWVHDYQLQLVPALLREMRPDLVIVFFLHIPFPSRRLFAQLPWRRQVVEGLLGADVIGFQRAQDAASFRFVAEHYASVPALGNVLVLPETAEEPSRSVLAQEFPISIDAADFANTAAQPEVQRRAREIRAELGDPHTLILGVDRLDYTKGIRHRLKAYAELLAENEVSPDETTFLQVATPSRERVEAYQLLRDEVEVTVGRINGEHGSTAHAPIVYLHQSFAREEMVALYLAADVLVVTALRDGMNLVAKEYVACHSDEQGVLVLSQFTGAAEELQDALLINPHDIEGMKAAFLRAIHMPRAEQRRRMRSLRQVVQENDVAHWAGRFLEAAVAAADSRVSEGTGAVRTEGSPSGPIPSSYISSKLEARLRLLATAPFLIVASDFDGTLAPIVSRPQDARILPRSQHALEVLQDSPDVQVALLSGRSIDSLRATGHYPDSWILSGSHGVELTGLPESVDAEALVGGPLTEEESHRLGWLQRRFERVLGSEPGVRLERKPFGIAVHTRQVSDPERVEEIQDAAKELAAGAGLDIREGKQVREFSVRQSDKGSALEYIRNRFPSAPVLFLGDDVTDEDVFESLGGDDLGIKVGSGDTQARETVADPETAAAVLALLAEFRTGIVVGSDDTSQ